MVTCLALLPIDEPYGANGHHQRPVGAGATASTVTIPYCVPPGAYGVPPVALVRLTGLMRTDDSAVTGRVMAAPGGMVSRSDTAGVSHTPPRDYGERIPIPAPVLVP